jgi:PRTRC genetic system protein E
MFTELDNHLNSCDIRLSLKKKNGEITVSVEYYNEQSQLHFPPVSITGTPDELDAQFISIIEMPVAKAAGIFHNAMHVTDQIDKITKDAEKKGAKTSGKKPVPVPVETPEPEPKDEENTGDSSDGITEPAVPETPQLNSPAAETVKPVTTKAGASKPKARETKKSTVPTSGPGSPAYQALLEKAIQEQGGKIEIPVAHQASDKSEGRPEDLLKKPIETLAPPTLEPESPEAEPPYVEQTKPLETLEVVAVTEPVTQPVLVDEGDDW